MTATMARQGAALEAFRTADARDKPFETQYYNAEIHQAALAQPEFFRRALAQALAL